MSHDGTRAHVSEERRRHHRPTWRRSSCEEERVVIVPGTGFRDVPTTFSGARSRPGRRSPSATGPSCENPLSRCLGGPARGNRVQVNGTGRATSIRAVRGISFFFAFIPSRLLRRRRVEEGRQGVYERQWVAPAPPPPPTYTATEFTRV